MKGVYILELKPFQCSIFTSVKYNKDCVKLLLETVRIFQVYGSELLYEVPTKRPYLKICKEKVNRLFVYLDNNKFISIQFPFDIIKVSNGLRFKFKGINVDSKVVSDGLSLLTQLEDKYPDIRQILDSDNENIDNDTYDILGSLSLLDFGYPRFDYDPKNEKGDIHPLHHLDINYSKYGTFKIKLPNRITMQHFEDIFDKEKPCISMFVKYLSDLQGKRNKGKNRNMKRNR